MRIAIEDQKQPAVKEQILMLVKNINYLRLLANNMVHVVLIAVIATNISPLLVINGFNNTVMLF